MFWVSLDSICALNGVEMSVRFQIICISIHVLISQTHTHKQQAIDNSIFWICCRLLVSNCARIHYFNLHLSLQSIRAICINHWHLIALCVDYCLSHWLRFIFVWITWANLSKNLLIMQSIRFKQVLFHSNWLTREMKAKAKR